MLTQFITIGILLVLMVGITWFVSIKPQQKRFKAHQQLLDDLKCGDKVMTAGGFIGKIAEVEEDYVILALDPDGVKAKINKQSIVSNMTNSQDID